MDELRRELRAFVIETFLFGQDDGFAADASFIEGGIIDSTGVLELVTHLEQTYGFQIADEELVPENLDSLDNLARFVTAKRAG